jgi:hypothetical protein
MIALCHAKETQLLCLLIVVPTRVEVSVSCGPYSFLTNSAVLTSAPPFC